MLGENILICWRILSANKFRTFLTVLGVTAGVAGVVLIMSLAAGGKQLLDVEMNQAGSTFDLRWSEWIQDAESGKWRKNTSNKYFTTADMDSKIGAHQLKQLFRLNLGGIRAYVSTESKNMLRLGYLQLKRVWCKTYPHNMVDFYPILM